MIPVVAVSMMLVSHAVAKPVETDTEAVDAFRAVWRQSLAKRLEARPFIGPLKAQVFEEGKVTAEESTSAKVLKNIRSTLTEKEEKESILFGVLKDLEPDREIWVVSHPGDIKGGFQAIVDPEDGDLIFFWIPPEG